MIKLKNLNKDMDILRPYIKKYGGVFNDFTLGTRFMWDGESDLEYAILNDTLIVYETYGDYRFFYYPVGENVPSAIDAIDEYCKNVLFSPPSFGCLTEEQARELTERYAAVKTKSLRDWCDYIYFAEQFKTYAGKKLSGQRNHVNKFKKLYPDYKVNFITKKDFPRIKEFLKEYESENVFSDWAAEEQPRVYTLLENMNYLDQFGIFVTVNEKIVSLSIGEIAGETLFVHVEKGLKKYQGVYPLTAQEFAKAFAGESVKYINREEDCGDLGLRTSKLQYKPLEVKEKYFLNVKTLFDDIGEVNLSTERLNIIENTAEQGYCKLCTDEEINEFWGYDYKKDVSGELTDQKFYDFIKALKDKKEEFSLAVKLGGRLIGEIVLWDFDFYGSLQIGFRFFKEFRGQGYATESVNAVLEYLFKTLKAKTVRAYCYKQNAPSEKLLKITGFKLHGTDEKYFYYEKIF